MTTWQSFTRKPFVRRFALGGAGVLILSTVAVRPAHSQFGIDIAAILAGLKADQQHADECRCFAA